MSRLATLKIAQLRGLLTAIGSKTSGRKSDLIACLEKDVQVSRLAPKTRILSVDMGIRNLAYCVCDVQRMKTGGRVKMIVREWKRIAVTGDAKSETPDLYTPPVLSKTAYALVKDLWAPYKANTVLIEGQRFRSGGGSAVLEWTLRVNMLESMIWAIFTALKGEMGPKALSPDVWTVSPKQVANYWIGGVKEVEGIPGAKISGGKAKIEKKQKIDLVHKWLKGDTGDGISLEFTGDATKTQASFMAAAVRGNQRKSKARLSIPATVLDKDKKGQPIAKPVVEKISKLDDLADCLLQAAAWCKWEDHKNLLASMILKGDEEKLDLWLQNGKERTHPGHLT